VLSIVDRGVVYAVAHVRGGSERGRQWYLDGKLDKKINTFTDFVAAAEALIAGGYTSAGRIVSFGGSAGGLLVGAAVNLRPDLFAGVLAAVPFVDVLNTMSDESLPLTPPEWPEWGDPIRTGEGYEWIAAYSPYDNIRRGAAYPPILATGGLADYRVTYWEPAKWIARLRDEAAGGPFVLRMNMEAGHAGAAARFEGLEERAHLYAFALRVLGLTDAEPVSHAL
jgi:oligopeptidase B